MCCLFANVRENTRKRFKKLAFDHYLLTIWAPKFVLTATLAAILTHFVSVNFWPYTFVPLAKLLPSVSSFCLAVVVKGGHRTINKPTHAQKTETIFKDTNQRMFREELNLSLLSRKLGKKGEHNTMSCNE